MIVIIEYHSSGGYRDLSGILVGLVNKSDFGVTPSTYSLLNYNDGVSKREGNLRPIKILANGAKGMAHLKVGKTYMFYHNYQSHTGSYTIHFVED